MKLFRQFVNRLRADASTTAIQSGEDRLTIANPPDARRRLPSDIGRAGATDEAYKMELASRLARGYLEWGDPFVPQILERMIDVRICSMITFHLAKSIFGVNGADIIRRFPEVTELFSMDTTSTEGRNVIDHSFETSFLMPVKYRGYGHPINSREHLGHLFQVNILCFPTRSRIIGFRDSSDRNLQPVKGLTPAGSLGTWKLYNLDTSCTDDTTAVFILSAPIEHRIVELCHYDPETKETNIIYRFQRK